MQQIKYFMRTIVATAPIGLPVAIAAASIVVMAALLSERLTDWYVLPVACALGLSAWWLIARTLSAVQYGHAVRVDSIVLVMVVFWACFNMVFTSHHLYTDRDPATYANTTLWLAKEGSLSMIDDDVFQSSEQLLSTSAGFFESETRDDHIDAQGTHTLPAIMGLLGSYLAEPEYALKLNAIIGGVALLAFYGLTRLIVRPWYAVGATVFLGAMLPLIYFSRDSYTEPLAMVFIFAGVTLSSLAIVKDKVDKLLWIVAGLLLGCAIMTRIDSGMIVAGVVLALLVYAAMYRGKKPLSAIGWLAVGMVVPATLNGIDLWYYSNAYFDSHSKLMLQQYIVLSLFTGCIAVITAAPDTLLSRSIRRAYRSLASRRHISIALTLIAIVFIGLISRPLWQTTESSKGVNAYVGSVQVADEIETGPFLYAEHTVDWISWYVGWPIVFLGLVGLMLMVQRIMQKRDVHLVVPLGVFLVASVYFVLPSITPDQIWASRRFIVAIIPLLIIMAAYALDWIIRKTLDNHTRNNRITAAVLSFVILLVYPLSVMRPFVLKTDSEQLSSISDLCKKLPQKSTVVWTGLGRLQAVQPTETVCNVPSAGFTDRDEVENPDNPRKNDLVKYYADAKSAGYVPVIAVYEENLYTLDNLNDGDVQMSRVAERDYNKMQTTLVNHPTRSDKIDSAIYAGVVQKDGSILPLVDSEAGGQ